MSIPRLSFKGLTINGRLLAWFLAISLIPCGILAALTSWLSTRVLEDSVRRGLMVVSDAKADEMETYGRKRLRWVTWVARSPTMVQGVNADLRKNGMERARGLAWNERYWIGFRHPQMAAQQERYVVNIAACAKLACVQLSLEADHDVLLMAADDARRNVTGRRRDIEPGMQPLDALDDTRTNQRRGQFKMQQLASCTRDRRGSGFEASWLRRDGNQKPVN